VSAKHAEVWEQSGRVFIKDVGSSNGTYINGKLLNGETEYELKSGDILKFGKEVDNDKERIVPIEARVRCVFSERVESTAQSHEHLEVVQPIEQASHSLPDVRIHGQWPSPNLDVGQNTRSLAKARSGDLDRRKESAAGHATPIFAFTPELPELKLLSGFEFEHELNRRKMLEEEIKRMDRERQELERLEFEMKIRKAQMEMEDRLSRRFHNEVTSP